MSAPRSPNELIGRRLPRSTAPESSFAKTEHNGQENRRAECALHDAVGCVDPGNRGLVAGVISGGPVTRRYFPALTLTRRGCRMPVPSIPAEPTVAITDIRRSHQRPHQATDEHDGRGSPHNRREPIPPHPATLMRVLDAGHETCPDLQEQSRLPTTNPEMKHPDPRLRGSGCPRCLETSHGRADRI